MNRASNQSHGLTAVAVYLPEQYPRLLATAEDAGRLELTWQAWHQPLQATKQMALEQDIDLIEMTVDLDALECYPETLIQSYLGPPYGRASSTRPAPSRR
ncbi:MAG: hypothetical protein J2P36_05195 [Ktedonobacteraceae bacterium]|nr:hypothetical protein [Ktedonobacteraceae bacterium]